MTEGDNNDQSSINKEKWLKKSLDRHRRKQRRLHYSSRDKEYDRDVI